MLNHSPEDHIDVHTASKSTLRGIDLNLLTVFDVVMQEQNITRAAQFLNMSQPAVSNAVSRLKIMFNDELFIRHGRGILPTQRARQLFEPIREALQLVRNELPGSIFTPETSTRSFRLAVCSPCDLRFAPAIMAHISNQAPNLNLNMNADFDRALAEKLRYQEIDFVIDYTNFPNHGFCSAEVFTDELVVVAAKRHPRLGNQITAAEFLNEKHATISKINGVRSFYEHIYGGIEYQSAYQGTSLSNILYVVSHSELITVAPHWLVKSIPNPQAYKIYPYPFEENKLSGYLTWHESSEKDKGHVWMRDNLMQICSETLSMPSF